jgi:hypothetical protein
MKANKMQFMNYMASRITQGPSKVAITSGKKEYFMSKYSEVMYKDSRGKKQWYDCNDSWVKAI